MWTNFYSEIFIINIKIDQIKFYHFNPLTEMTEHGQEGTFRTRVSSSAKKTFLDRTENLTERVKVKYGKSHRRL